MTDIGSYELTEWMVYAQFEPFGEERADLRAGIVASTIANVNRRKNKKPAKVSDFMPKFGPIRRKTNNEMLRKVEELNARLGGADLRKVKSDG